MARAKAEEIKKSEVEQPKQEGWKITAPNKAYTGTAATVEFVDGIGYTKNETIKKYFESKGFEIE